MKNWLLKCIPLFTLTLMIASCSQTQDIATNDGPQYRYRKVYEGNKIIYRDKVEKEKPSVSQGESSVEEKVIVENPILDEQPLTASAEPTPASDDLASTFMHNLHEVRTTIATGSFLQKLSQKKHSSENSSAEEDDSTMIGTYEIFAILGFAFGLSSLFGGLLLAILGIVFSILGLNSGYRILALIGLICGAVGVILVLI